MISHARPKTNANDWGERRGFACQISPALPAKEVRNPCFQLAFRSNKLTNLMTQTNRIELDGVNRN